MAVFVLQKKELYSAHVAEAESTLNCIKKILCIALLLVTVISDALFCLFVV